jgi:CubicO group peptidase (beta-lactamase class C family)
MLKAQPFLDKGKEIEKLIKTYYDYGIFNGAILVADSSNILYKDILGYSDITTKNPLSQETSFGINSLSKQFTAFGIMILKEKGLLKYEDPFSNYIDNLPKIYRNITIRNLLNQTSGIRDYSADIDWKIIKTWNHDSLTNYLQNHESLMFTPGDKFYYCNTNYALLAIIIEKVSKTSYAEFLKENIFSRLSMSNTFFPTKDLQINSLNTAKGYFYISGIKQDEPIYNIEGPGSIYSTVDDLYKWDRALYTDILVSCTTIEEAYSQPMLTNGEKSNYGFGWVIENDSKKTVDHNGSDGFSIAYIERHRTDKTVIIILSNNGSQSYMEIKDKINNILNDKSYTLPIKPKIKKEIKLNEDIVLQYVGLYKDPNYDFSLTVTTDKNHLYIQSAANNRDEVFPISVNEFFSKQEELEITFIKESNKVTSMILNYYGEHRLEKIK